MPKMPMIKTGGHFNAGMMVATTKKTAAKDARIAFEEQQTIKPFEQNTRSIPKLSEKIRETTLEFTSCLEWCHAHT